MGPYGHVAKEIKARALDFLYVDFVHENRKSNVTLMLMIQLEASSLLQQAGMYGCQHRLMAPVFRMTNSFKKECGVS